MSGLITKWLESLKPQHYILSKKIFKKNLDNRYIVLTFVKINDGSNSQK
jgi:hypothetical protein